MQNIHQQIKDFFEEYAKKKLKKREICLNRIDYQ